MKSNKNKQVQTHLMCMCLIEKRNSNAVELRVITWIFLSFVAQYPNKWYLFFHKK